MSEGRLHKIRHDKNGVYCTYKGKKYYFSMFVRYVGDGYWTDNNGCYLYLEIINKFMCGKILLK